jgi:hypothetical protein
MLTPEFENFCESWLRKADAYKSSVHDHFDRFFTQFVVFNRIYAEATFRWARQAGIRISNDHFPDGKGAKEYILNYVGAQNFVAALENQQKSANAIDQIIGILQEGHFSIRLHMVYGTRQRAKDLKLLQDLLSPNAQIKGTAILTFVYSIRCNTFHGHKGFDPIQIAILEPTNVLLRRITEISLEKLRNDH